MLEWMFIERLLISALLGGLIGIERETRKQPAGFRTHVLVCMGAALFTLISVSMMSQAGSVADMSRIAAGVVTGIGFLAAGSIFRARDQVRGLTTAADIWVVAAVGMAVGFGYYTLAALATIISLLVLILGKVLDSYIKPKEL
jgi:putative Mg2+ transporter-C (MgtC) family protein